MTEVDNENCVTCKYFTGILVNNNPVRKIVNFYENGTWTLKICEKEINLEKVYVPDKFQFTKECIRTVFETVVVLRLCFGIKVNKSVIVTRFYQYEQLIKENGLKRRLVRSILFEKNISMSIHTDTCRK